MTKTELEDAVRNLCDGSKLSNSDIADVMDFLKVVYNDLAADE